MLTLKKAIEKKKIDQFIAERPNERRDKATFDVQWPESR